MSKTCVSSEDRKLENSQHYKPIVGYISNNMPSRTSGLIADSIALQQRAVNLCHKHNKPKNGVYYEAVLDYYTREENQLRDAQSQKVHSPRQPKRMNTLSEGLLSNNPAEVHLKAPVKLSMATSQSEEDEKDDERESPLFYPHIVSFIEYQSNLYRKKFLHEKKNKARQIEQLQTEIACLEAGKKHDRCIRYTACAVVLTGHLVAGMALNLCA